MIYCTLYIFRLLIISQLKPSPTLWLYTNVLFLCVCRTVSLHFTSPARRTESKWWNCYLNTEPLSRPSRRYCTTLTLIHSASPPPQDTRTGFLSMSEFTAFLLLFNIHSSFMWITSVFLIVWPDPHPRGSLYGSREHCPFTDASRSITQHHQRSEWIIIQSFLHLKYFLSTCIAAHKKLPLTSSHCVFLQRGETALHMAARAGQADVVQYLLKNGAKVETKSKVRALSPIINHCVRWRKDSNKRGSHTGVKLNFFLLCRTTRQRCTSPVDWGKSTSCNSCCSAAPLPTPPPPQATPPFTWLPVKDTKTLLPCCWIMEPHSPQQLR